MDIINIKPLKTQINMRTVGSFALTVLMLLATFFDTSVACPRPCACYVPTEVHCTFRSLGAVPAAIPKSILRVNLGFNIITRITQHSFAGLRKLELLMMHGNDIHKIPNGIFQDLLSLQVLKMSYNKVRVITGPTLLGLKSLVRLHLDHNRIEFIHPDAFSGMTSLRLVQLDGNHLQKLHPATFSTFSLLQHFPVSTLKHLYLSDNLLTSLPGDMLRTMPQLENLFLHGNPWTCDCRLDWVPDWSTQHPGVMKCKKDKAYAKGQLCPICSSPQQLRGKEFSQLKQPQCLGPVISSPGRDVPAEENLSELLSLEEFKLPFGNVTLKLSDEHGNKVDLICQILKPRESTKITWNYTKSLQIITNMTLYFDLECPMKQGNYDSLWRLLAYYSEIPVHLQRELMLSKEPELSYRYQQDIERDAYYYTGVRANVLSHPSWLMQSFLSMQLNRRYSTSKSVKLILTTQMSSTTDSVKAKQQRRSWVIIEHNNMTQTTFSSVVGGMIEMDCSAQSSGEPSILWMLPDGSKVKAPFSSPSSRLSLSATGKLLIKAVEHSDSGVYYCVTEIQGNVDLLAFRLSVVESSTPPIGDEVGIAVSKFVGESISLPCHSTASPDAVVDWIFPDGSVINAKANSSKGFVFSNGTLFIVRGKPNDSGYYKCVALNQHGVDFLATKLNIMRRQEIETLRHYRMKPQSAAGLSTKVKTFLDDTEESSGDEAAQSRPRITTVNPSTIMVDAGTDVRFPCESVGDPKPFLTWTKVSTGAVMSVNTRIQRFEVQPNGTFVIRSAQLQDRGRYLCTVQNPYAVDKMMVTLMVLAQKPRMLLPKQRDVTAYLEGSVNLECRARGLPSPYISWMLPSRTVVHMVSTGEQRIVLLGNGTLHIKQTSYPDRGDYKCIASNVAGADSAVVRLHVAALPPVIQQKKEENYTISEGQTVHIHCSAKGAPTPSIRWVTASGMQIRPSQFINSNLFVFPNGTLYIRSSVEKDSGTYECVALNGVGAIKRSVSLLVKRNSTTAKITSTSPQRMDISYGGNLSLDCRASGIPEPRIIWRTPMKKLIDAHYSFDPRMKVFDNGTLTIKSVTDQDQGGYLCVARNKMGDDYVLLKVNVMMKAAKIEGKQLSDHKVQYGGDLKVDCVASGLPNPEIRWSLPDGSMVNSVMPSYNSGVRRRRYVVFDNGTLYFNDVGLKEEGNYTCFAENQMGKDEMKIQIKVLAAAPTIRNNTYEEVRVAHGETVSLTCSAKGEPSPSISWLSPTNRIVLPASDKYQLTTDGTLLIQKVQKFDSGNYTCTARNRAGMDRKVVHIEVLVSAPIINGLQSPISMTKQTAKKDQRVLLHCNAEGTPVPQVMWVLPDNVVLPAPYYGSRITVHRNGTLDIRTWRKSDSAQLLCIAQSAAGEAQLQVQLNIVEQLEKPQLKSLATESVQIADGVSVTLNCSVEGKPAPEITWLLPNGTTLQSGTSILRFHHKLDGSLVIREPTASEVGIYRCMGRNSAGYVERTVTLEYGKEPHISNKYNTLISIINGENLQLNCQSSGNPSPNLTWILPSGVVLTRPQRMGQYAIFDNGTLSVQQASVYDRGTYRCESANKYGFSSLSVAVIVIAYPPRITSGPAGVTYARPGVAIQLNCMAIAIPKAEVTWEMPDKTQLKAGSQPRLYGN
ncbi:hypothetical protein P4O66_008082, partial [Electrophorus voltai]